MEETDKQRDNYSKMKYIYGTAQGNDLTKLGRIPGGGDTQDKSFTVEGVMRLEG